jgi:hypothetical protein
MMVTTSPTAPAGKHRIQARPYSQPAPNKVICTCAVTLLPITGTAKNRRSERLQPLATTAAVHTGQQQGRLRFWEPGRLRRVP